ncbi:MAG: PRC-barrel domain-containing protein [Opitutaceae bacterium]
MLQNTKQLYGRKLGATDGEIGHVKDFYFDDQTWMIRYLVVDTGPWLTGRQVLLTPHAFGTHAVGSHAFGIAAANDDVLHVKLTRKQIEDSPSIDAHRPISRQYEDEYHRYYGWQAYWQGGGVWGLSGLSPITPIPVPASRPHHGHNQRDDLHLRSTKAATGYSLHANDGEVGSVSGFMLDGPSWQIRELAVETGHWYAGKMIYVRTKNITRISYDHSSVFVNLSKADIAQTTGNAVAHPGSK